MCRVCHSKAQSIRLFQQVRFRLDVALCLQFEQTPQNFSGILHRKTCCASDLCLVAYYKIINVICSEVIYRANLCRTVFDMVANCTSALFGLMQRGPKFEDNVRPPRTDDLGTSLSIRKKSFAPCLTPFIY